MVLCGVYWCHDHYKNLRMPLKTSFLIFKRLVQKMPAALWQKTECGRRFGVSEIVKMLLQSKSIYY